MNLRQNLLHRVDSCEILETVRGSEEVDAKSFITWFKVAVSAADSADTERDRARRLGSVSGDTRKTLHRELKQF